MNPKSAGKKWLRALLMLYLVSTAFLEWPLYPAWNDRLQLPELIFLLAAATTVWYIIRQKIPFSWSVVDCAVAAYLLLNILSAAFNFSRLALLEIVGRSYLVGVYLLWSVALQEDWINWRRLRQSLTIMAVLIILSMSIAYVLLKLGIESTLLVQYRDYPYLGTIYRAKGFLQTPSMFISIVNFCFLGLFCDGLFLGFSRSKIILLCCLFVAALLSFSKAVLLLVFGMLLAGLFCYRPGRYRRYAIWLSMATATIYFGLTNFVYSSHAAPAQVEQGYLLVDSTHNSHAQVWMPTTYYSLKKATIQLACRAPLLGIGPGSFLYLMDQMKAEGIYPQYLPAHDPHSIYFGTLAETGIVGLSALLGLITVCFRATAGDTTDPLRLFLFVWLCIFAIEGLNGDLMNFRHYWVQFGLIGGLASTIKP